MQSTPGKLIGVSLGPGDPDLITRAAWTQLQRRDTRWVYPVRSGKSDGYAHGIVQRAGIEPVSHVEAIVFPMTYDAEKLGRAWLKAADTVLPWLQAGEDVLFLVEGDASTYSTFSHLARTVRSVDERIETPIIAGVNSYTGAASVAGTTLGLIQAYMLAYGDSSHATFTLFERMADTLLGAVIAWAFAYILPSWERGQIPAVVQRTIDAQIRHAKLALDPEQLKSVEDTPELEWRLARREAFDSLSALVQATQRSLSEPRAVRPPIEALQYMQVHCYQLLAQLSAVKALLVLRRDRLNLPEATAALENAIERIERKLGSLPIAPLNDSTAASTLSDQVILPDPFETEITPWLLRRLDASTNIAIQIRDDASRVLQILDWSAGQHLVECDAA